jgi:hypothetical protein
VDERLRFAARPDSGNPPEQLLALQNKRPRFAANLSGSLYADASASSGTRVADAGALANVSMIYNMKPATTR